jgi:hypothetical protein
MNVSQLSVQLTQLRQRVGETKESLDSSSNLSQIINAGISSLEVRKTHAKEAADAFDDIVQLRTLLTQLQATIIDSQTEVQLEQATYLLAKALALFNVLN